MDLCFSCQRFNIRNLCREPTGWGTFQLKLARDGARSGCSFCLLLLDQVLDKIPSGIQSRLDEEKMRIHLRATKSRRFEANDKPTWAFQIDGLQGFLATAAYKMDGEEPIKGSFASFHVCAEKKSYASSSQAITGRFLGRDATSPEFLEGIQDWLTKCLGHPRCRQTFSGWRQIDARDAPLPTRCIDVAGEQLLLRETGGMTGAYITLSHRWNTETQSSQTTRLNIQERLSVGFKADQLPKTFRDAMCLARKLKIRYVWIDSICIIQGAGSTDWAVEAGKMAGYYQGSLFTIAAAGAAEHDSLEGLLPAAVPAFGRRIARLPFYDNKGVRRGFVYIYPALDIDTDYNEKIRSGALQRRGWVFQEWLLSRRVISFTAEGVYFNCQTELPRNGLGDTLTPSRDHQSHNGLPSRSFASFEVGERLQDLWLEIVESYSALELSFPNTDRLVALSGIAAEFSEARQKRGEAQDAFSPYVSGMWFDDIHRGLLWQAREPEGRQRLDAWMPTWSWASFPGSVTWGFFKRSQSITTVCEVVGLATRAGAVYPTASVSGQTKQWNLTRLFGSGTKQGIEPRRYSATTEHYQLSAEYTGLLIQCRACEVHVWDTFTPQQLESLPVLLPDTAGDTQVQSSTQIRKISLSSTTDSRGICGWAAFEDPAFQDQRDFWDGQTTYAIHILTSSPKNGWLERGLLGGWESLYMVILVRTVEGEGYRRIGMGGMWGSTARKKLKEAEIQVLQLV